MEKKTPCIAMVPCPGLSHLIPLVEFAKRLVLQHPDFHVTLLIPTLCPSSSSMKAILEALPPTIDFTLLPQVNIQNLPQDTHPGIQMQLTVFHSLPSLRDALSSLSSRYQLLALVFDLLAIDALHVAKQFNLLAYIFFASGATTLSFCFLLPKLDETVSGEFTELSEPVKVPGSNASFQGRDLPDLAIAGRSSEIYRSFLQLCKQLRFADGVIVNSFIDLEAGPIRVLQEQEFNNHYPVIYPVGPIINNGSDNRVNGSECLRWLDNQPRNSVLYVSFGSGGTLSQDQLNELAFGLELSGHKFLWVVRVPSKLVSAAYLNAQNEDPLHYLPSGFLERTKEQGLVVPSWAPQIEILKHGSTGGFLTHCGWNSILESTIHGVPMIVWPLFAEQRMNAVTLTDELKIALWPQAQASEVGIVERQEISEILKRLMEGDEGKEIRRRIEDLKEAGIVGLSGDGSSKRTISSLAHKWRSLSRK